MKLNKRRTKRRFQIQPYLWLLPAMIVFAVFTFFPFVQTIYRSLFIVNSMGEIKKFVGFENYLFILQDEKFRIAVKNTLLFMVLTVPTSKILGFLLAMLANKKRRLSAFYETSFALPMAMATSVIAMIFQLLYVSPLGMINGLTGLKIGWLTDSRYALFAVAVVQIWLSTGYAFVFMLSAVRSVPKEVLESADIDGAGTWRKMISVYLPLTTPTLFYLIVTDLAYSMMVMGLVNVLTAGGPNNSTLTLMQYIYQQFAGAGNYTNANPAAVLTFLMTLVCTLLAFAWEKKGVHYQ